MDSSTRAQLIRDGNRAFNEGDYPKARELFTRANYHDGLVRIGDHYMYDRRLPLLAYGYYKKAGANKKIEDLHRRMVGAIGTWLGRDSLRDDSISEMEIDMGEEMPVAGYEDLDENGMIPIVVHPALKRKALEFLNRRN